MREKKISIIGAPDGWHAVAGLSQVGQTENGCFVHDYGIYLNFFYKDMSVMEFSVREKNTDGNVYDFASRFWEEHQFDLQERASVIDKWIDKLNP